MANFQKHSMLETWLNRMGIEFIWKSSMKFEELFGEWDLYNEGRPDVKGKTMLEANEDVVMQYAEMFEAGSAAPGVIVHSLEGGYAVDDGVLRLSAAKFLGYTRFGGYVVVGASAEQLAAIRRCANPVLNGKRASDEWTISAIVDDLVEKYKFSAKDCSVWSGYPVNRFDAEIKSRIGKHWLESHGVDISAKPCKHKGFQTEFARLIDKRMRSEAPEECAKIARFCVAMRCNNGEAEGLLKECASVKRKPKVPLSTQLHSKLSDLTERHSARLKYGKTRMNPVDAVISKIAAAVTSVRNAGKLTPDHDQSAKIVDHLDTLKRLLRKMVPREDWKTESDIIV